MHQSMTGFASGQGSHGPHSWVWDIRSVNAKGLDQRLRIPDWLTGLEANVKKQIQEALSRGNVSLTLRVTREEEAGALTLNTAEMARVIDAMAQVEQAAIDQGLSLAPSRAADILAVRGVLTTDVPQDDGAALAKHLQQDFAAVLETFVDMRRGEGAALIAMLTNHLDQIETLLTRTTDLINARRDEMRQSLDSALQRVTGAVADADPQRIAQELALIAVKSDVTEEIDRLTAHIAAARKLLAGQGPAGRKLDFLAQEFNREANTLCSKSQNKELTALGLELKTLIDQMREQVQNLE